jgi:hypothetical protein
MLTTRGWGVGGLVTVGFGAGAEHHGHIIIASGEVISQSLVDLLHYYRLRIEHPNLAVAGYITAHGGMLYPVYASAATHARVAAHPRRILWYTLDLDAGADTDIAQLYRIRYGDHLSLTGHSLDEILNSYRQRIAHIAAHGGVDAEVAYRRIRDVHLTAAGVGSATAREQKLISLAISALSAGTVLVHPVRILRELGAAVASSSAGVSYLYRLRNEFGAAVTGTSLLELLGLYRLRNLHPSVTSTAVAHAVDQRIRRLLLTATSNSHINARDLRLRLLDLDATANGLVTVHPVRILSTLAALAATSTTAAGLVYRLRYVAGAAAALTEVEARPAAILAALLQATSATQATVRPSYIPSVHLDLTGTGDITAHIWRVLTAALEADSTTAVAISSSHIIVLVRLTVDADSEVTVYQLQITHKRPQLLISRITVPTAEARALITPPVTTPTLVESYQTAPQTQLYGQADTLVVPPQLINALQARPRIEVDGQADPVLTPPQLSVAVLLHPESEVHTSREDVVVTPPTLSAQTTAPATSATAMVPVLVPPKPTEAKVTRPLGKPRPKR